MFKAPDKKIKVNLYELYPEIEELVDDMCNKLGDLPFELRPVLCDGIIYAALFDDMYTKDVYWEEVTTRLSDNMIELFESYTEFDFSSTTDVKQDCVLFIADVLAEEFTWTTRYEMEAVAFLVVDQVIDMFTEYDLASDETYSELCEILHNAVHLNVKRRSEFHGMDVNVQRRHVIFSYSVGMLDITNLLTRRSNEVLNEIHFRHGSNSGGTVRRKLGLS